MQLRDVIGQQEVKQRFVQSVKDGRVSHAQLIYGPEGSGGLPLALAFAQYLTCEQPADGDSCGKCPSCLKNQKMVHPDVHYSFPVATVRDISKPKSTDFINDFRQEVIDKPYLDLNDWFESLDTANKQGFMSVEESADILRKLHLKSYESPYKIVIQWMPEKMRTEAANKLLKIIEEPPDRTIFFLVTENRDQILGTILSRTQLVKVKQLTIDEIEQSLIKNLELPQRQAHSIAFLADGNYHLALQLAANEASEVSFETSFIEWMRLCFQPVKSIEKLLKWVDAIAKSGRESQKQFLMASMHTLRECIIANMAAPQLLRLDDQQQQTLKDFIPFIHNGNMHQFIHELNDACFHVERNANPKILFLDLSFRLNKALLQRKA